MTMLDLDSKIIAWLQEDIGSGDITSLATVPETATAHAIIHAKDTGILAGIEIAQRVFTLLDPTIKFTAQLEDGAALTPASVIATIDG